MWYCAIAELFAYAMQTIRPPAPARGRMCAMDESRFTAGSYSMRAVEPVATAVRKMRHRGRRSHREVSPAPADPPPIRSRRAGAHGPGLQHAPFRWSTAGAISATSTASAAAFRTPRSASRQPPCCCGGIRRGTRVDFRENYAGQNRAPGRVAAASETLATAPRASTVGHGGRVRATLRPSECSMRQIHLPRSPKGVAIDDMLQIIRAPDFPTGGRDR